MSGYRLNPFQLIYGLILSYVKDACSLRKHRQRLAKVYAYIDKWLKD